MVKIVLEEVNQSKLTDKIIYSSFDWRVLREIKNSNPEIPRAYLSFEQQGSGSFGNIYDQSPWMDFTPLHNNVDLPKLIKALGGKAWHPFYRNVTEKIVETSHNENLPVNVWTVNDEEDMLRMIDIGVDGIMTDYPVQLKELCEKKNINWF